MDGSGFNSNEDLDQARQALEEYFAPGWDEETGPGLDSLPLPLKKIMFGTSWTIQGQEGSVAGLIQRMNLLKNRFPFPMKVFVTQPERFREIPDFNSLSPKKKLKIRSAKNLASICPYKIAYPYFVHQRILAPKDKEFHLAEFHARGILRPGMIAAWTLRCDSTEYRPTKAQLRQPPATIRRQPPLHIRGAGLKAFCEPYQSANVNRYLPFETLPLHFEDNVDGFEHLSASRSANVRPFWVYPTKFDRNGREIPKNDREVADFHMDNALYGYPTKETVDVVLEMMDLNSRPLTLGVMPSFYENLPFLSEEEEMHKQLYEKWMKLYFDSVREHFNALPDVSFALRPRVPDNLLFSSFELRKVETAFKLSLDYVTDQGRNMRVFIENFSMEELFSDLVTGVPNEHRQAAIFLNDTITENFTRLLEFDIDLWIHFPNLLRNLGAAADRQLRIEQQFEEDEKEARRVLFEDKIRENEANLRTLKRGASETGDSDSDSYSADRPAGKKTRYGAAAAAAALRHTHGNVKEAAALLNRMGI